MGTDVEKQVRRRNSACRQIRWGSSRINDYYKIQCRRNCRKKYERHVGGIGGRKSAIAFSVFGENAGTVFK